MNNLFANETLGQETEYEKLSKPIKENINRIFNPRLVAVLEKRGFQVREQLHEKIALADTLENLSILNEAVDLARKYQAIVTHMFYASGAGDYMKDFDDRQLEPLLREIDPNSELNPYGSNIDAFPASNEYKQGNITFRIVRRGSAEDKAQGKKKKTKKRRKGRKAVRSQRPKLPRGKKKKKKTYKKK